MSTIHRVSVIMPVNNRKEMLLQQKDVGYPWNPNQWTFFGGKIEEGETPEQALIREIREELGQSNLLENISHFGNFPFYDVISKEKKREGFLHVYSADFNGNISDIKLKEGKGFTFLSRQEMNKYDIVWHNRRIINFYYDSLLSKR